MSIENKSDSSKIIKPLAVPVRSRSELQKLVEKTHKAYEKRKQEVHKEYPYLARPLH